MAVTMRDQQATLFKANLGEIVDVPLSCLRLDTENPRLAAIEHAESQPALVKLLWDTMAVDEVALSIAANGFFPSEPLFAIIQNPLNKDPQKQLLTVIEGNRRLAAVLLLCDDELRQRIKATSLPEIDAEAKARLQSLPVVIYEDHKKLWPAVGFRHINGVKPWDSFSKAAYIVEVHEKYKVPLLEIAGSIGDRHTTVTRLYRGYKVMEQAESMTSFDRDSIARARFYFSHLYTALDQREYQEFLGLKPDTSLKPNPVPKSKIPNLEELMSWFYGNRREGLEPLIQSQNPDLNTLRSVISDRGALAVLRRTRSLAQSFEVSIGDQERFRSALVNAKAELQTVKATVITGFAGEQDQRTLINEIKLLVNSILKDMGET